MKTIFLASGQSSRMEPFGDKNLLKFCGKPFFLHLLENAKNGGLKNFVIVTNGKNTNTIASVLQKANFIADIAVQRNLEHGQAGGVLAGLECCKDDEDVFILGGNDVVQSDVYKKILKDSKGYDGGILAQKVDQYFPGGYLQVGGKNEIISIIEKPGEGNEPSDMINVVTHYFSQAQYLKKALQAADFSQTDAYEKTLLGLFKTKKFIAVKNTGDWHVIKYPWHILRVMKNFLSQQKIKISSKVDIAKNVVIKGDGVVIESGVRIFENAVIQGPCYLGKNVTVGNNALVRDSMVGKGSVIGYNTEIARSFLSQDVTTHYAYIGDSVVDQGVNFGAFSCTTNMRLDQKSIRVKIKNELINSCNTKLGVFIGKNTQIGAHSVIMPGVKIKKDEFLKPGEIRK
jgi:bifunctional UDP-N-acetylglucosamine pyrophosphorylase/glucosamine-1-phosphate N-acetyltransferase